jgi:hypothetical protein
MEIALALIYALLQIMPADTQSFTLNVTPDTAFYGTRQEGDVWRIETGKTDKKAFFGDARVEKRQLIIKTKDGEIPFEAADKLALPDSVDWQNLKEVGEDPVIYEIRKMKDKIEFSFVIQGAEHPQTITASFKP